MYFAFFFIAIPGFYFMNKLMDDFCEIREIPDHQQKMIFQTANVVLIILLVSSYVELLFL